jgi:hypothetical protein
VFGSPVAAQAIGIDGEMLSAKLRINVTRQTRFYPAATYAITIRRADGETYPGAANLVPDNDGIVEYVLSPEDLAIPGKLEVEARLMQNGEVVIKSTIWPFTVSRSLAYTLPSPPALIPQWADEILQKAQSVIDAIHAWEAGGGGGAIADIQVDNEGRLVFTLSDETTIITGRVVEPAGNADIDELFA